MDIQIIQNRIKNVLRLDEHGDEDGYVIRSIYFDDMQDTCMLENEAGISRREKYRIRMYNHSADTMRLEIKDKNREYINKKSCQLSQEEYEKIIANSISVVPDAREALNVLKVKMRTTDMRPKAIIEYERKAYVHKSGNVRITFDRNIMVSGDCKSFQDERVNKKIPILPTGMHVLEVKYDEFIPAHIMQLLELGKLHRIAFSKYYLGRLALQGEYVI